VRVAPRLTIRRLRVIQSALVSKLADDLSDDQFSYADYEAAADWVAYQEYLREQIVAAVKARGGK
jgi:hypothetical protein